MEQQTSLEENNLITGAQTLLPPGRDHTQDPPHEAVLPATADKRWYPAGDRLSQLANQHKKRTGRVAGWMMTLWAVLPLLGVLLALFNAELGEQLGAFLLGPLLFIASPLVIIAMICCLRGPNGGSRKEGRKLVQTLASLEDVHTLGPLIDGLKLEDSRSQQAAIDALIKLLPRLQSSEADLLNANQRAQLCRQLDRVSTRITANERTPLYITNFKVTAFRVAILEAFAQVGDSTALPIVERLAQQTTMTTAQKQIQAAARACLPLLQIRAEQERNPRTLLRAASMPGSEADTLLRATAGTPETPPEQLLRPTQPDL